MKYLKDKDSAKTGTAATIRQITIIVKTSRLFFKLISPSDLDKV